VRPSLSDPRIWAPPGDVAGGRTTLPREKSSSEKLDSVVASTIARHADSMRIHAPPPTKFERGDWTVETNGQKWGIDQQFIRLGKVSIPTALLALLPLNQGQSNPIAYEREKALAAMRRDILEHQTAQINEAEFRKTVRAIRERKDRERREAEKQKVADKPVMPAEPPPDR
jgi:hypothetical protein